MAERITTRRVQLTHKRSGVETLRRNGGGTKVGSVISTYVLNKLLVDLYYRAQPGIHFLRFHSQILYYFCDFIRNYYDIEANYTFHPGKAV